LPKRLIDLTPGGKPTSQGGESARLVLSREIIEKHPKYTTLSYCWGSDQTFKTTSATMDAFHQSIPVLELPRSFADAFDLTRQLNVRYIWIDALCIVQDDKLDWETEVATMHNVYIGSFLTIQASEAVSVSEGCFVQINPAFAEAQPCGRAFFTALEPNRNAEILVHIVPHTARIAALNQRGWTLQETVLSHRTIQLTDHELHWRCRSDIVWETGIVYENSERLHGNVPPLQQSHDHRLYETWWTWMENYSERRFSFPGDRLPGIAGLAEFYQRETNDVSCLGLWRRSMQRDLAWLRIGTSDERPLDPPLSQPLPSWSPFACRQTIQFNFWNDHGSKRKTAHYTTEVLDCAIEWSGTPFISDLRSSKLVLRGPTREIYLAEATEIKGCNPPYFNINSEVVNSKELLLPWRCAVQWDKEGFREPSKWLCLLLQRQTPSGFEFGGETFLVLEALENVASESMWRRIGIGSLGRQRSQKGLGELTSVFELGECQTVTLM
jgi:hypothetical protein